MFRVSLRGLQEAESELRTAAHKNQSIIETIEDIRNSLRGMSGMDGPVAVLGNKIEELRECQRSLLSLCNALETTCDLYSRVDREVSEYCEGNLRGNAYPGMSELTIKSINVKPLIL